MAKAQKSRASKIPYVSLNQLEIVGFESPFSKHLDANNRWVILARQIPWDKIVNVYQKQLNNAITGAGAINPRVASGAIFIQHMCDLSDRETVQQIQENVYMQYFIGYSSFSYEPVFDPSLFVDLRKRFGADQINEINETIMGLVSKEQKDNEENSLPHDEITEVESPDVKQPNESTQQTMRENPIDLPENKGNLIVDATACPQDISYPTDLNLLNDSRQKAEELIDFLYNPSKHEKKPRTYREIARKVYLKTAQKKKKTKKEIRIAIRKQLGFLKRDIKSIYKLLNSYESVPFNRHQYKYFLVIQTLHNQQEKMYREKIHSVEHRIVSIHQPHVRPIVRGKTNANVEFGAKIQMSIMNGITFLEDLSWEAFNEGTRLMYRRKL